MIRNIASLVLSATPAFAAHTLFLKAVSSRTINPATVVVRTAGHGQ